MNVFFSQLLTFLSLSFNISSVSLDDVAQLDSPEELRQSFMGCYILNYLENLDQNDIRNLILTHTDGDINQLEKILKAFKQFNLLAKLDQNDIGNLILTHANGDLNQLKKILKAFKQFNLLANLDQNDIRNLILTHTDGDLNQLEDVLYAFKQFNLLAKLDENDISNLIVARTQEDANQLKEILYAFDSVNLLFYLEQDAISNLILAHTDGYANQLEAVLEIFQQFNLLDNLSGYTINNLVAIHANRDINQLQEVLKIFNEAKLLQKLNPDQIIELILAHTDEDANQLQEVLKIFNEAKLLQKLNPDQIIQLILAQTDGCANQLQEVLKIFNEAELLQKLNADDISDLIETHAQGDSNAFLSTVLTFEYFNLLENYEEYSVGLHSNPAPFDDHKWLNLNPSHQHVLSFKQLMKANASVEDLKIFLQNKTTTGFPVAYYLWQSHLPLVYKEAIQIIYPELSEDLPGEYGMIMDDPIYTYYFHKNKPENKIALVLQGTDHNGALLTDNVDLWFTKGYNVLAVDARHIAGDKPWIKPHPSLEDFAKAHQINVTDNLQMMFINMHGVMVDNLEHYVQAFEIKNDQIDSISKFTDLYIGSIICEFNIRQPLSIVITSCESWPAVSHLLKLVPNGSEILSLSKYRIENGLPSIASNHLIISQVFLEKLYSCEFKNFDQDGRLLKEIAVLYASILYDATDIDKGGVLYGKKLKDGTTHQVIFEDEVGHLADISWDEEATNEFIDIICFDDECRIKVASEMVHVGIESSDDLRYMQEAFAGYIALGGM